MSKVIQRFIICMFVGIFLFASFPFVAFANAAEPPSLVILVKDPPRDLSIILLSDENRPEPSVQTVAWEGYYSFYSRDLEKETNLVFKISSGGTSFEWSPQEPLQGYNNVFTLNLQDQTVRAGKYPLRAVLLILLRLLITFLIEGCIFALFGFKEKRSWIVFFAVNAFTQGALNLWLNVEGSLLPSYLLVTLIIGEFFVFAVEMVAFPCLLHEHKNTRAFLYVFVSNFVSLLAGGLLISFLPV